MKIRLVRARGFGKMSCRTIADKCNATVSIYGEDVGDGLKVSWGARSSALDVNRRTRHSRASDKGLARLLMFEKGVQCCEPWFNPQDIKSFPVVIRPNKHSRGRNFFVAENVNEATSIMRGLESPYASVAYDKKRELRVHVAHGKVLAVIEKILNNSDLRANRSVTSESWRVLKWDDAQTGSLVHSAMLQALFACRAIELDFCAVDVMVGEDGVSVLECNTAPSVNGELVPSKYAKYLTWLSKGGREHWDFERFDSARALFWKNKQLEAE